LIGFLFVATFQNLNMQKKCIWL